MSAADHDIAPRAITAPAERVTRAALRPDGDARGAPRARRPFRWGLLFDHLILIAGCLLMVVPVLLIVLTSTHDAVTIARQGFQYGVGDAALDNYRNALFERGGFTQTVDGLLMLGNSMVLGLGFAVGKIVVSMLAAYAIVYFRFRFATFAFWLIFATLLLPLEVRILPSYEIVQRLGLLNSYTGLILPLIASATGTFFFRQFFKSVPDEMLEAARLDGAGPWRFFKDILVPLSRTMIAALFIIMFVLGWNQYLWPTLMTTDESYFTLVRGIRQILLQQIGSQTPEHGKAMALAIIAMLPPVLIVVFFQRWFVKGLVDSEK